MLARQFAVALPVFALLGRAGSISAAHAQSVQILTPAPVQTAQSTVIIAPSAPPPPRVETIPPPPTADAQVMYWRPGHWTWSGANWIWTAGEYVQRPAPQAVWAPGPWVQQPTGGYVWVDGRWEG